MRDYLRRLYRTLVAFLFARANYRFFLRSSFGVLDTRIRTLLCATNTLPSVISPIPVTAPFGSSMLVVAPHPDDEIIGCGGAIALQKISGRRVAFVFVQDGGDEHEADGLTRAQSIEIRRQEALSVARSVGIDPPTFLLHADLGPDTRSELADELQAVIEASKADVIFTPSALDHNIHHIQTNLALARALSGLERSISVYGYEVWGLTVPNVIVNIDSVMEEKRIWLSQYKSQLSGKDYVNAVTGLNMYHSISFGAGECKFAERFFQMPSPDFVELIERLADIGIEG